MLRNSRLFLPAVGIVLAGCAKSPRSVFVDLDALAAREPVTLPADIRIPNPPPTRPELTETVSGSHAIVLGDPANAPTQTVQQMFKAGQDAALDQLQARLKQLNKTAVLEFRLLQTKSIEDKERNAYEAANNQIRKLFDDWATERAPKFAQLALISGFPDPNPNSTAPDENVSKEHPAWTAKANSLRLELNAIDARFKAASQKVLASVHQNTQADQADLQRRLEQMARDLDKKAEDEAKAQIRNAVSKLQFQLADSTPIKLPETPSRHLSIPAEKPLEPAPRVPSSGILVGTADRRRSLEHELRIWLALNRYTLSASRQGHRDATQEFQIWRQQHGAGP